MVELVLAIAYDYDDGVAAMVHDHGRRRTIVRSSKLECWESVALLLSLIANMYPAIRLYVRRGTWATYEIMYCSIPAIFMENFIDKGISTRFLPAFLNFKDMARLSQHSPLSNESESDDPLPPYKPSTFTHNHNMAIDYYLGSV